MQSYGAVPRQGRPARQDHVLHVALAGLAAVAVVSTTAAWRSLGAPAPVALASSGGWLSAIESQFTDTPTSAREKAVRMQLAAPASQLTAPAWQHLAKGSIKAAYNDGITGARLDQLTPAGKYDPNNVPDKEKQQMVTNLTRSGVEVDHWPWDSPFDDGDEPIQHHKYQKKKCQWNAGFYSCWEDKGKVTQLMSKQDSIMHELMGAFADTAHANPMLSKSQLQALKAKDAKEQTARASAHKGIPQKDLERLAISQNKRDEKMAMRKSKMLAAQAARKAPVERERRRIAKPHLRGRAEQILQSPLQTLKGEEGDEGEWGVDVAWNGHNDRCSETTPNCNSLGKRGDGQPGVHVYGWPWDHDATESMKQRDLAMQLQGEATQLLRLSSSRTSDADAEETAAQDLQARSFDMFKLASFQKLEEDDVSNSTKMRWPMFPKWYWTPADSTEHLEKEVGMPIDQWPWEDCHGVDCKNAVDERRWERTVGQKLKQDAVDMSDLAYADAQMGLFPKLQTLEEEDEVCGGVGMCGGGRHAACVLPANSHSFCVCVEHVW